MTTTETLHSAPVSTQKCPNQERINLFVERFSSGKPYLFFDVFGSDPLSSKEYNSIYMEMIRFMREEDEGSPEVIAIQNVFFANLVKFFQIYGHKKFVNDEHEFIEDLSYQTVMHILAAIKKGGTFELERGFFLSYAIEAIHSTRVRLAQMHAKAKKAFPMSQLDNEDRDFISTISSKEPEEDLEAEILVSKVRSAIESVFKNLSEKEIKKKWGDIFQLFFLKKQSRVRICKKLEIDHACFAACHYTLRKRLKMAIVQRCDKVERKKLAETYLTKAIGDLPETQREMVSLYLGTGEKRKTREEIARHFHLPISTSNKKLKEGLERIKKEFLEIGFWPELISLMVRENKDIKKPLDWLTIPRSEGRIYIKPGLLNTVNYILQSFTPREQFILSNYMGLEKEAMTTTDIGVACGISQGRVMQIVERGIRRIKGQLKNEEQLNLFKFHICAVNTRKFYSLKKKQWVVLKDGESEKNGEKNRIPEELIVFMNDNLNDSQKKILRAILQNPDMTYAEIGEKLKITQSSVSKAVAKILPILKQCDCLEVAKTKGEIVIKIQGEIISQSQKDRQEIEVILADIHDPREKIKMIIKRFANAKTCELLLARLGYIYGSKTQKELASFYGINQGNLCVILKREFGKLRKYMQLAGIENEFDVLLEEVNRIQKTKKEETVANVSQEKSTLTVAV